MKLVLQLSGKEGQPAASKALDQGALTIGRGEENDWVLPDPERLLSKKHCVVEGSGGQFALTDTSTNGVFVNYSTQRLERGARIALQDGDILRLGSYEIVVQLAEERLPQGSADDPFGGLPDPYDEAPILTSRQPVAARDSFDSADNFVDSLGRPGSGLADDADPLGSGPFAEDPLAPARGGPGGIPHDELLDPEPLEGPGPAPGQQSRGLRQMIPDDGDLIGPGYDTGEEAEQWEGPTAGDHSAAEQAYFTPPKLAGAELPEDFAAIPEDWDNPDGAPAGRQSGSAVPEDFGRPPEQPKQRPPAPQSAGQSARRQPQAPPRQAPSGAAPLMAEGMPGDLALGRAFLAGAGVEGLEIPDEHMEALMRKVGAVFRQMVGGLRDVLMARAEIKNEFRIDKTMIGARENNPLKFSASVEETMRALLLPTVPGYLPAEKAVDQGFDDLKAHQMAVMAGMQVALNSLLKRFDPEVLGKNIEKQSGLTSLVRGKKAAYWDAFIEHYEEIAREAEDDFQSLFGREFSRAYEKQTKKF